MIGGLSGTYSGYGAYIPYGAQRGSRQAGAAQALPGGQLAVVLAVRRGPSLETPVEPVRSAGAVSGREAPAARLGPVIREGADPAEMAVRMRIKPYDASDSDSIREGLEDNRSIGEKAVGAEGAQAALEEGICQTCEERKYQDESDDMGVSFQSPTRIAPEQVAAAVRGHENEHVVREQAKARQEDRRVISQSVTLHTDICPECGKVYISGGTTRTVTAAGNRLEPAEEAEQSGQPEERTPFSLFG